MEKFLIALLFVGGCFFGALAEYVAGRVLLPAMGLTAPGHWTWFWVLAFAIVGKVVGGD